MARLDELVLLQLKLQDKTEFFKAYMNSVIPQEAAAMFILSNLYPETGYWLGVCHG